MSSIIDDLIAHVLAWQRRETIDDVRIGLGYTALKLNSGHCGLACVLKHRLNSGGCSLFSRAGSLTGCESSEFIPLLASQNVLEASLALALINAFAQQQLPPASSQNSEELFELLQIQENDRVGMVGDIVPMVKEARRRGAEVFVFDEGKSRMPGITAIDRQAEIIPSCDICILSATSLLNHSLDGLLALSTSAREICLVGPSTPLIPDFFRQKGVTILAGRAVTHPEQVLRVVSEAGGTMQFRGGTEKVTLPLHTGH